MITQASEPNLIITGLRPLTDVANYVKENVAKNAFIHAICTFFFVIGPLFCLFI